jgi:hypothetical protein
VTEPRHVKRGKKQNNERFDDVSLRGMYPSAGKVPSTRGRGWEGMRAVDARNEVNTYALEGL